MPPLAVFLSFAFTLGALSLFSPCVFPLLTGYIIYVVGSHISTKKAFAVGGVFTVGLLTVLAAFGAALSLLGEMIHYVPLIQLLAGVAIIGLGLIMLVEIPLPSMGLSLRLEENRGLAGMYIFGLTFGLAVSGCKAPIFFSILLYAILGGILQGAIVFIFYALGMGLVFIILSVLLAKTREHMVERIAKITPWLKRISGVVLLIAGAYLIVTFVSTTTLTI